MLLVTHSLLRITPAAAPAPAPQHEGERCRWVRVLPTGPWMPATVATAAEARAAPGRLEVRYEALGVILAELAAGEVRTRADWLADYAPPPG
ncbi:MAG: hypothetical protein JWO31_2093 [Phycisphaerales bacterium]|nr:hypothetical protein [Phycisphaerales bacterium]